MLLLFLQWQLMHHLVLCYMFLSKVPFISFLSMSHFYDIIGESIFSSDQASLAAFDARASLFVVWETF
jgi:hypothetical protein